ncbi:MAG: hypothetical protein HFI08_01950 [Bacilli bacterium]|jgi:hypothetical protein|nr:hypothetical protein [Bacilli bacterium]
MKIKIEVFLSNLWYGFVEFLYDLFQPEMLLPWISLILSIISVICAIYHI